MTAVDDVGMHLGLEMLLTAAFFSPRRSLFKCLADPETLRRLESAAGSAGASPASAENKIDPVVENLLSVSTTSGERSLPITVQSLRNDYGMSTSLLAL